MRIGTVFCIDGSGNKNLQSADAKRPIFRLDCENKGISRPLLLADETAEQFFVRQIEDNTVQKPVVIATDVPLGLPAAPADVLEALGAKSFLTWLIRTDGRLKRAAETWREGLVAIGIANRTALKPFVSVAKGDKIKPIRAKRVCDIWSNGESVYCIDHGGKQVGRAALQFWFEVLLPLRRKYRKRLVVWPFQAWDGKDVIIAECYPAKCQRLVYGRTIQKRQSFEVAKALSEVLRTKEKSAINMSTWIYAASSEDEFDMFTTALAFSETLEHEDGFFWHPADRPACRTIEGWMLGLRRREDEADKE